MNFESLEELVSTLAPEANVRFFYLSIAKYLAKLQITLSNFV